MRTLEVSSAFTPIVSPCAVRRSSGWGRVQLRLLLLVGRPCDVTTVPDFWSCTSATVGAVVDVLDHGTRGGAWSSMPTASTYLPAAALLNRTGLSGGFTS